MCLAGVFAKHLDKIPTGAIGVGKKLLDKDSSSKSAPTPKPQSTSKPKKQKERGTRASVGLTIGNS